MKKLGIILITTFVSLKLFAGIDDKIRDVVNKWNEIHNSHNSIELLDIYAAEVLFYGNLKDRDYCYMLKSNFLKPTYQQQIITPIDITHYSSGTIKCDFTKRSSFGGKPREHVSYLLIKKINNKYLITGESDIQTDEEKNVQLQIGTVKLKPGLRNALYFVFFLLILAGIAIWFQLKRKKERVMLKPHDFSTIPPTINLSHTAKDEKLNSEFENKVVTNVREAVREEISKLKPAEEVEKQKGKIFEDYISKKFDLTAFRFVEWRGDKFHEGRYAQTSHLPDMEWELIHPGTRKSSFAVECKYRSKYSDFGIELGKEYQLNNYKEFEKKENKPVFIVLGIGGQPDKPEELFIIPLKDLYTNFISKHQLIKYKKPKTAGTFFYNPIKKELT